MSDLRLSDPATAGRVTALRRMDRRVALVTGGGSGAGASIARRCAQLGASVVVADIDFALAGEVAAGLRAEGVAALAHRCDVAVDEQVTTLIDRVMREFGSLDFVVNNAGPWLDDDPREHWARIVGANLLGTLHVTRASIEALKRRGGAIVNIASGCGLGFGSADRPAYSAAKAGIMRFTAALQYLQAEHGIRVNCIVPDTIDSADDFAVAVVELAMREDCAGRVVLYRDGSAREVVEYGDPGYRRLEPW